MTRTIPALLLLLGLSGAPTATAQAPAPAPSVAKDPRVVQAPSLLTAWLDAEQAHRRLPGVSLALIHDQQPLLSRGFGYAHVETKAPATASTA
jgi:CubicO group peptidase (beta-lactamase class C family)